MSGDLDWQSLADPTTTTAIYMPTRTLPALTEKAIEEGLDPQTPALAIACATRPDQAVVTGPIGELSRRIADANLAGPVLVMLGRALEKRTDVRAGPASARQRARMTSRHRTL
jgi:uroporphyrin-III C-methyltransferase/precorrin-2 dehydrogenase/sirohydrochlorin ferrochelatase